jgi:hypothetical protein
MKIIVKKPTFTEDGEMGIKDQVFDKIWFIEDWGTMIHLFDINRKLVAKVDLFYYDIEIK